MTDTPSLSSLSRSKLLRRLPTRRASMILVAIENQAGYLVGKSRQVANRYLTEKTAEELDRVFMEALSMGREAPIRPSIQDLEHFAPQWAALAAENPSVRAGVAHLIGQKYRFTYRSVPTLRQALGLDTDEVKQAFEREYKKPLDSIYAQQIDARERLRWAWARFSWRLENLPPFWMAFALTVTLTIGASILALPIALAGIGPLAGVVILVVLGIANTLTIVGMAEAITRNGNMRYGNSYFGRLVSDYLGKAGVLVLSVSLLLLMLLALVAFYMGVSSTLAGVTGVPAWLWTVLLFLVGLYFLRRESLGATIASALVIGAINIVLILLLSAITLPHVKGEYLQYLRVPFVNGQPFDPSILGLVFGVILTGYFGHTATGNAAKYVLRRDPSGRSLIWGNAAAMGTAIVLYCLWTVVVGGAIEPSRLANQPGTALGPLAEIVGPAVHVFGTIFVVLSMGMSSVQIAFTLFNQVREWLPARPADTSGQPTTTARSPGQRVRAFLLSDRGRFWIGVLPVAVVTLVVVWLLISGQGSFSGLISLIGIITVPILAGIFAMLMLVASRRKGEYVPGVAWGFVGRWPVVAVIYLLFLASILLHGLVIWQDTLQRLAALAAGLSVVAMTVVVVRQRAFRPRAVVEFRTDEELGDRAFFQFTVAGKPMSADVHLNYDRDERQISASSGEVLAFKTLRSVVFRLPSLPLKELKVWVHQITLEGTSQPMPVRLEAQCGTETKSYDLEATGGQILLPLSGQPCQLTMRLA